MASLTMPAILAVEDSIEDFEALVRVLRRSGVSGPIARCVDGDDALDYLHRRGRYIDAGRPVVVLLDLNLPGTDGREVLEEVKADPELRRTPVIVLTTSSDARDVEACYQAGANSYMVKPVDLEGFAESMTRMKRFWLDVAVLPGTG
ncbi:MAG: response regulator [Bryobacteraceae bacterium]